MLRPCLMFVAASLSAFSLYAADGLPTTGAAAPAGESAARESDENPSARLKAKREELSRLQSEIRALEKQTGEVENVLLQCRIVEIPADAAVHRFELQDTSELDAGPRFSVMARDRADEIIESLRADGRVKILAEPSLVTTNGHPARFHSGGEFAIPIPNNEGGAEVEWREFGVSIEAEPHVLGDGRVRLQIVPEYAVRDFSNVVQVEGVAVPGLTVRRIRTEIESEFGQTHIILMHTTDVGERDADAGDELPDEDPSPTVTLFMVTPEPFFSNEP
jgi:Flp pilus assembly secretin CpaC